MVAPEGIWREWITPLVGILSSVIKRSFRAMNLRYIFLCVRSYHHPMFLHFVSCALICILTHCICILFVCQFDYLKSLEIEEKINKIRWCQTANGALFLLSTNDKTIKFWKARTENCVCNFSYYLSKAYSNMFLSISI